MTDDTHHMGWTAFFIEGVAHGLAVDGEAFILPGVGFVPALQGAVQVRGFDADQHIADDRLTGHDVTALFATAAEALARLLPQTLRPVGDRPVAAHAAQDGPGGDAQHGGQAMAPALGTARIGNLPEKRGQGLHLRGGEHDFGTSALIRGRKNGLGQQPAGIGLQGLDEDHLGRLRRGRVPEPGAAKPARVPHIDPVRRSINGPPKAQRVDESFQQEHAMPEGSFPVARQTPLADRQNP